MTALIKRRLDDIVRRRMAESPVVLLQGPRSVGKSTLLQALARRHDRHVIDLDDLAVRAAVANDPGTVRLRAQAGVHRRVPARPRPAYRHQGRT